MELEEKPCEERPPEAVPKEVSPRDFVRELKSIVESTPMSFFDIIGEEAMDFRPLSDVVKVIEGKLGITTESATLLMKLLIMLRLVEYDEMEDRVRSLEPIARFIARMRWGIEILDRLIA